MNIKNTLLSTGAFLIISFTCSCGVYPDRPNAKYSSYYPDRNQDSIVASWGIPAEILLRADGGKLGKNVVTWVYYLEDESGEIAPVFFNFKNGNALASNAFGEEKMRVLNVNVERDLKKILLEQSRIRKTWPVWNQQM